MTSISISTLPTGTGPSVSLTPTGDAEAFAALLQGLATGSSTGEAGTGLPETRQGVAAAPADAPLPGLDMVLETGEGVPVPPGPGCAVSIGTPLLPTIVAEGAEQTENALPPGLQKLTGEIAAPGKSRASLHARPLPMPFRTPMESTPEAPDASTLEATAEKATKSPARAEELVADPAFAPEAPQLDPRHERKLAAVSARVADTPAIERAAAQLDPVRTPPAKGEAAPSAVNPDLGAPAPTDPSELAEAPLPVETAPSPSSKLPETPIERVSTEPASAAVPIEPAPPEGAPARQAAEIAARVADPMRDRSVPPPVAGLTPSTPEIGKPRAEIEAPREHRPADRPFEALAAMAAGQSPLRPLPAALAARTPAEPSAFAELVTGLETAAPATSTSSFGFHPATPVQMRAAEVFAPGAPVVDTSRADWLQAMIERIGEIRTEGGAREAQIRLAPDALGIVDIRIEQRDDRIHVAISADTPQARALLSEAAPRLQEMAEARGLRLSQSSVDAGQSQQQQRRSGQDGPAQPNAPASGRRDAQTSTPRSQDRIA